MRQRTLTSLHSLDDTLNATNAVTEELVPAVNLPLDQALLLQKLPGLLGGLLREGVVLRRDNEFGSAP